MRPHLVPLESLGAGLLRDLEGVSTDARQPERPRLPRAARVRPRRRPAPHPLALVGQGDGLDGGVRPAGAPVPRHPAQPRHDRGRRPARRRGPTPRTSRRRWRSRPRSPCARCSTSSTCRSSAARTPRLSGSDGHLALDAVCRADFGGRGIVESGRQASSSRPTPAWRSSSAAPSTEFTDLLRGAAAFPPEVRRFGDRRRPLRHQPGHRDRRPPGPAPRRQGRPRRPAALERAMTSSTDAACDLAAPGPAPGAPARAPARPALVDRHRSSRWCSPASR